MPATFSHLNVYLDRSKIREIEILILGLTSLFSTAFDYFKHRY